uniref:Lipocalin n=1 Tax=Rhipicephalus appendiculatus TaxID=34631 RepID=A0A131YP61_RHIAP
MRRYGFPAVVLFFLPIIAANSKGFPGKSRISRSRDIRKFLNTREPIWTYNSTLEETLRCQVDVMSKCTEKSIQYNRSYYINSQVRTERLEGWFLRRRRDEMFVAVIGNMPVIAERLVYSTKDLSCGVFQVVLPFPGEDPWYDLRIKNSSILAGPSKDCSEYFRNARVKGKQKPVPTKGVNSKAAAKPIYDPHCQRILRPPSVLQPPPLKDEHL